MKLFSLLININSKFMGKLVYSTTIRAFSNPFLIFYVVYKFSVYYEQFNVLKSAIDVREIHIPNYAHM
jgi:hypothetical protein